jgi:hypothetical protein
MPGARDPRDGEQPPAYRKRGQPPQARTFPRHSPLRPTATLAPSHASYVRYFTSSALDPCAGSAGAWRKPQAGSRAPSQAPASRRRDLFSILHGATLPAEGPRRRDGLDWWPAKGPRRPPGPGPPRTLPARSSPGLSSAPAQAVERPATDSTPGLDPRARPRGDPDTFGRCGHLDHLSDHRDASLARLVSPTAGA